VDCSISDVTQTVASLGEVEIKQKNKGVHNEQFVEEKPGATKNRPWQVQ
jgi:hypothetical protein